MKKTITFAFSSLFILSVAAQNNLSFERWENQFGVPVPQGWVTQNFLTLFSADSISCRPSNDAAHGMKSARLRSVESSIGDTTYLFPGTLSQFVTGTARPKSFRFYYRAIGDSKDTFYASLTFHKGRILDNNTVGTAAATLPLTNQWTAVELNVDWTSSEPYDTALFGFTCPPRLGAELYVDNVDLSEYGAGVTAVEGKQVPVFIHHKLQLPPSMQEQVKHVSVFNPAGLLILKGTKDLFDVSGLPAGIYVLSLTGKNGDVVYSGKFLKQ